MKYDVIVAGGGIAGLTSAAFLVKNGYSVLVCEKEGKVGGLANSFWSDGFLYDSGARGIIDSGIVKPMLKQLGINIDFVKSPVTIGIEKEMIRVDSIDSLSNYRQMLVNLYPHSADDIDAILNEIQKVLDYMAILYGIENPLFKDIRQDKDYLFKTLLPWVLKFQVKSRKIRPFSIPVREYLQQYTDNHELIDIISQHFFQETPASFALSYFSLYMDYEYPKGGVRELAEKVKTFILDNGGEILTDAAVKEIDSENQTVILEGSKDYSYRQLIWAADTQQLYKLVNLNRLKDPKTKEKIVKHQEVIKDKKAGDSIFSLYLAVNLNNDYFASRSTGHLFYTPNRQGQSSVSDRLMAVIATEDKDELFKWMEDYLDVTTYEIAIPSLRNEALAPKGQTGLIISVLMDYQYIKVIQSLGLYSIFKKMTEDKMISVLDDTLYGAMKDHIIHQFSSTPITIERISGNFEGGITGWAFTNKPVPAEHRMTRIKAAASTPIPSILQAGQWTFSPSGLPISILTGKIAADEAKKKMKKKSV